MLKKMHMWRKCIFGENGQLAKMDDWEQGNQGGQGIRVGDGEALNGDADIH